MDALDKTVLDLGFEGDQPSNFSEGAFFIAAMRKLAAEGKKPEKKPEKKPKKDKEKKVAPHDVATTNMSPAATPIAGPPGEAMGAPAPDEDLAAGAMDQATGAEATPAEAEAHYDAGLPDTTGHLEGEFAVPVEQVAMTMSQIVSQNLKQHLSYIFYGEMLRDLGRSGLVELFEDQAAEEIEEAKYFLRRISVLIPGGMPVPPPPTPEPLTDPSQILTKIIAGEQQAIVLFKTLHSMLGENPMKYTVEQNLTGAQEHLDKLWQFMPAEVPEKTATKIAAAVALVKRAAAPKPGPDDVPVPPPGTEPMAVTQERDNRLQAQQLAGENEFLKQRAAELQNVTALAQTQAQSAQLENQGLQQQMQLVQQQSDIAGQQAQQSMAMAQQSSEQAASEADAKMRLAMRIQQFRQQLASIIAADPVQEEGVGFGDQAGAGAPQTPQQQQQQAQAEEEQAALTGQPSPSQLAQQPAGAGAPGGEDKKPAAKSESSEKKPAAEKKDKKPEGKGTEVTVKTK